MGAFRGLFFFFLFFPGTLAGSFSHSMRGFYTATWDPSQAQPQVAIVIYVDDQLATQYNSSTRQALPQVYWMEKMDEHIPSFWEVNTLKGQRLELRLKKTLENLKERSNQSTGFLTFQLMTGCEIRKNGHKEGYHQYSYNGRDFLSFDPKTQTWTAADLEAQITQRQWDGDVDYSRHVMYYVEEECPEDLQRFVEYGKESLLRRETPVVTISRKAYYDGLETLLCRVHGFYPKEIDVNWKRDGEVWVQDTFSGGILPNADGTYHTWISIEVEPKERDRYRCHVEHDSLEEPLVLAWEDRGSVWPLVGGVLGAVVGVLLVAAGIILYKKKGQEATEEEPQVEDPLMNG
uniref:Ig-like domain-containing protein n=2 Tax=Anolis carolinensis TaxID=28377 RepID=H9GQU0_ANOCA